ncbi:PH domain-containing protein [Stackebrandtia nassauensis]|uniref:Membrane-flanked domain protein n=1 Tax=Stackebrandtia nassauensis (strain DSM 44728 / CIP 108903 / NRRL B-16338 / NBRC 102104 / LLR-40K-21) TaxID=446470 RepID=D3Q4Z4_STANL|nr:PH domain-containing protein [Stackebrandtia nassauensis]ADD42174.1 membrane-flanked domain protein [Stackebrandtia nassauensis DSM 44728]
MPESASVWSSWPGEVTWHPVAPQYLKVRLVSLALFGVVALAAVLIAPWLWWGRTWALLLGGVVLAGLLVRAVLLRRAVRAWGYAERDDDLLIRHGVLIKRLSIVPYGRMQFIDVSAGPVDRMFDLATVKLHTAAATTDSTVPGLAPDVATGLRDRLAQRATAEREGL